MSANKEVVADYLHHVWNDGDYDACDRYLAPSYTIHHDPGDAWDGQVMTPAAFKERVRMSRAPFPDQRFEIQEMITEANRVAVTWHWEGTFLHDLPGFTATGKRVKTSGITIYYIEGDRLSGHWQVTDRLSVFQQLR
jgi:steroid delta-isomerase-like uncharacterized protein